METHKCDRKLSCTMAEMEDLFEQHDLNQWGPAVGSIIKLGDVWFAYNDEYATPILYCPFCGVKLK